jgi:O-antigen/teichoic acid export membrane protein
MDKALDMGKTSVTGSFHLLIGVAGSTIIMAIGTLILASLLPVSDVGLYGVALIPSTMINYFRDWGVNYAMIQQIASLRASGKDSEIHDVILSGVIFEVISGALLSLVCFGVAEPLALVLSPSNAPNLSIYISIMSLSIFAGAILSAATAVFVGFERMKLNSFTTIFQAVVKTALGPFLIVIGFGVLGAIYGALASFVSGAVVGIAIVYFAVFRQLRKCKVGKCDVKQTLRPLLRYGLPLTVSGTIVGVVPQVFAFFMAVHAGTWMMGNYYASIYFSVLLTFISIPVGTALFPAFSKLNPEKEPELIKTVYASSVKYTSLLLVPATLLLITISTPLINTLFPQNGILNSLFVANAAPKYPYAPLFLAVSSVINLLALVGSISVGTFQQGIGKTNQLMKQSLLTLIVGLPLAILFVAYCASIGGASFAVLGGIVGILISSLPAAVWSYHWTWKNYGAKPDFGASAKILVVSVIASGATYLFISFITLPGYLVTLVCGLAVFLIVFLVAAPLLGAVNQTDINNLKSMFSGLGIISKILNALLMFMLKVSKINSGNDAKKVLADNN